MRIPALGDIFTLYRTQYLREVERSQRLESELMDARNRLDHALARAERAEDERSEVYQRFINHQSRTAVFPLEGTASAQGIAIAPDSLPQTSTRRLQQVADINKFMDEIKAQTPTGVGDGTAKTA